METKKYHNRFTEEVVAAVRFTGKQEHIIEILDWVIDNDGRAQGQINEDTTLTLQVHERGIGFVIVKPGEWVIKTDSGFEVIPVLQFSQLYKKVSPVIKVMPTPQFFEAIHFTGGVENENDIDEWLAKYKITGSYRHAVPGTTIEYYRVEMPDGLGSIDIRLGNWLVRVGDYIQSISPEELDTIFQRVT